MNRYAFIVIAAICLAGCATSKSRANQKPEAVSLPHDTGTLETAELQMEQRRMLIQRQ